MRWMEPRGSGLTCGALGHGGMEEFSIDCEARGSGANVDRCAARSMIRSVLSAVVDLGRRVSRSRHAPSFPLHEGFMALSIDREGPPSNTRRPLNEAPA